MANRLPRPYRTARIVVNYFISKTPLNDMQTGAHQAQERRRVKRHPLRSRALIGIQGQPSIRGSMIDVSAGAASVALPIALNPGTECMLFFTVTVEGQLIAVSGAGTVVNCVCSGLDGFRIGMRFSTQDVQAQRALHKLLGQPTDAEE
jgi:hypothetical protein